MTKPPIIRRAIALDDDDKAIMEPDNTSSALIIGGIGSGKTTTAILPAIQAMIADRNRGIIINDVKNGEIGSQIAEMAEKLGRKFGVIDPCNRLGADFPWKKRVNELSGLVTAYQQGDPGLLFIVDNVAKTLVPDRDDPKNHYWYEEQRIRIRFGLRFLLERSPSLCTLGGLSHFISDIPRFDSFVDIAAEEAEARTLRVLASQIREMRDRNPEHHFQHMGSAISALHLFDEGPLHHAGFDPDLTHEEIMRDNWIICSVLPARFMEQTASTMTEIRDLEPPKSAYHSRL
ncbi:type IV secretory system conjugative DNA transfer family protein [Tateyamaria sp. ANG-S1]|uniref:type IV secretory system conjugative DNA transfer family protein n=1 Tax=Tateyamaria sp. ANG-S1 TaxID=1577905 RepID=UPI00057E62F1|nr:type IV secretory system conjugative DNA transfer family protein [Tateyamaria sp. ANG-S1]KIC50974.1 hypothetical protein RA29_03560 [Tateyamaria sp. ANG-S1]